MYDEICISDINIKKIDSQRKEDKYTYITFEISKHMR